MSYSEYVKDRSESFVRINGAKLAHNELLHWMDEVDGEAYEILIKNTYHQWFDDRDYIEMTTSGSTGLPKLIRILKEKAYYSALMSLDYFQLKEEDRVLLVLPANKIGGLMLIIRSIIGKLDLNYLKPRLNPSLKVATKDYQFCSITPAQLSNILDEKQNVSILRNIQKVLLGGSPVSEDLEQRIRKETNHYFLGFGMTETISHVAVRKLNGLNSDEYYTALEGVQFSTNSDGQLIINAPLILDQDLTTNDLVVLAGNKRMKWLGRMDNVVNSGGIKLLPELIEQKVASKINHLFYLVGEDDEVLGEKLVMIVQNKESKFPEIQRLLNLLNANLDKLERPKKIYFSKQLNYTQNGKLVRSKPHQLSISFYKEL